MPMVMAPGFLRARSANSRGGIRFHVGIDHQHRRIDRGLADGGEIFQRIVGEIVAERRIDGDGADGREEQRVAVGLRLRDILRRDRAAGARLVFDRDRHAQQPLHFVGDQPRGDIGGAARRESDDQPDRTGRIILGACRAGEQRPARQATDAARHQVRANKRSAIDRGTHRRRDETSPTAARSPRRSGRAFLRAARSRDRGDRRD